MKILMRPNASKLKPSHRDQPRRWNIVRGDTVQVIQRNHPEYGKQGTVSAVIRDQNRVIVANVNMAPKNVKGDPERGIKGQTVMKDRISNQGDLLVPRGRDESTHFQTKWGHHSQTGYIEDETAEGFDCE